jgi:hypothetical protein
MGQPANQQPQPVLSAHTTTTPEPALRQPAQLMGALRLPGEGHTLLDDTQ